MPCHSIAQHHNHNAAYITQLRYCDQAGCTFLQIWQDYRLILITTQWHANCSEPICPIAHAAAKIFTTHSNTVVVWSVHPNPTVRQDIENVLGNLPITIQQRICLTAPLNYPSTIALLVRCYFTLSDSGCMPEAAPAFAKPVLVASNRTERQELVDVGGAHLVGTDIDTIERHTDILLTDDIAYLRLQIDCSPFGDGKSSQRIATMLSSASHGFSRSH